MSPSSARVRVEPRPPRLWQRLAFESSCSRQEVTGPRVSSSKTPSGHFEICTKIEGQERRSATV